MKYITHNSLRSEAKPMLGSDRVWASLFVLR
jgi:hypothetical protein